MKEDSEKSPFFQKESKKDLSDMSIVHADSKHQTLTNHSKELKKQPTDTETKKPQKRSPFYTANFQPERYIEERQFEFLQSHKIPSVQ